MVTPRVRSVNVGMPRTIAWAGRLVTTSIWKSPVAGRVRVEGVNLAGDAQADRRVHGGVHKAVYAYGEEDYAWWSRHVPTTFEPGVFGENLTTAGIDLTRCVVGERWDVGSATLEVSEPRLPCFKLGIRMGDATFVERFEDACRPGTYLRIVTPGDVAAGDTIRVHDVPDHGLTVVDLMTAEVRGDERLLRRILENPDVSDAWVHRAERRLEPRTDRAAKE